MTRIVIEFDGESSVATIRVEKANFMQMLAAADLLRMEAEGMYAAFRMGQSTKPGKVIDIARGIPGMPGKES